MRLVHLQRGRVRREVRSVDEPGLPTRLRVRGLRQRLLLRVDRRRRRRWLRHDRSWRGGPPVPRPRPRAAPRAAPPTAARGVRRIVDRRGALRYKGSMPWTRRMSLLAVVAAL